MSKLKVLDGKELGIAQLSDISTIGDIPGRAMLAPCVTKWPTSSGQVLLTQSFIRLKRIQLGFENNRRLVATQMHYDQALVDFAMRTFSRIDVLFNNAAGKRTVTTVNA